MTIPYDDSDDDLGPEAGEAYEMVQTYGVANEHEDATNEASLTAAESDALLGGDASVRKPQVEGHATLHSCVGNLANTIIGSGECCSRILRAFGV